MSKVKYVFKMIDKTDYLSVNNYLEQSVIYTIPSLEVGLDDAIEHFSRFLMSCGYSPELVTKRLNSDDDLQ